MIPVDGQLMVMDDFVPTDEKKAHVANANEHFKKGEHQAALKELSLSDVKIVYNRLWMPIMPALKRLDQALKLMDEHRYYEANLALKAVGDNLTIETDSMTETPKKTRGRTGGCHAARIANRRKHFGPGPLPGPKAARRPPGPAPSGLGGAPEKAELEPLRGARGGDVIIAAGLNEHEARAENGTD